MFSCCRSLLFRNRFVIGKVVLEALFLYHSIKFAVAHVSLCIVLLLLLFHFCLMMGWPEPGSFVYFLFLCAGYTGLDLSPPQVSPNWNTIFCNTLPCSPFLYYFSYMYN